MNSFFSLMFKVNILAMVKELFFNEKWIPVITLQERRGYN